MLAVATPAISVPVKVQAQDDYGVNRVYWLRGHNRSIERPFNLKLELKPGPQSVEAAGAFDLAKLGVRPGDSIEYYFEAADNYPKGPNLALSRIYRLEIISQEQFDEILRQAARELHEVEGDLAAREERLTGFWEKFFREVYISVPETGYVPPALPVASDEELFAVESDIIRKAAAAGGAVIVGRCAFHVLRGVPAVVNVFLHADEEFRCRRLMELYGIGDADVARRTLADSDRQRRRFVEAMTGVDWSDARNYHLAIDTGFAGLAVAEELIVRLATEAR